MNLAWMRRIDHWMGMPLTWLIGRVFTRRPQSLYGDFHPEVLPDRVIVTKFLGLGSVVLSLPLLKALRDQGVKVAFWSFPGQADLLKMSGCVDEIWTIRPGLTAFLPSLWKSWRAARRFRAGAFIDLEPTANFTALLARLSGTPVRIGFMSAKPHRESLFTHLVSLTPERHMIENNLSMGRLLGLPEGGEGALPLLGEPPVSYVPPILPREKGMLRVVININASDLSWHRMWPDEYWVEVCHELLRRPDIELVFPGSPAEGRRVSLLIDQLIARDSTSASRVINLAGRTSLLQLVYFLKEADLVISVDSGIMHLAAWAGAPLVALFGPETPRLYAPRSTQSKVLAAGLPCSPCLVVAAEKITRCQDNQCMKRIFPSQVISASRPFLNVRPSRVRRHQVA